MPTKFAILGDGAWGTAIALLLAGRPDHRVTLRSARTPFYPSASSQTE